MRNGNNNARRRIYTVMESVKTSENRLGTESIGKLLIKMSLPMMISMLVLALYNVVDTYFVAKINEKATSALTIAFPFQMLITGIAVGTSVGISSLISRRLGEKNQEAADNAAVTGIVLMLISGVAVSLIYLFFSGAILRPFSTDAGELRYATQYLRICGSLSFFVMIGVASEKIIQGTGNAIAPMIIQIAGAVTNIILDPILIFGYAGFPKMGVAGAAVATVAGQIVSMLMGLYFLLFSKSRRVKISFKGFKMNGSVVKDIYDVGIPSVLMQSVASFVTLGIYAIINTYLFYCSIAAKCVLGIYFKLQSFVFMPVFGLNSGSLPIMAYNYGARSKERFTWTLVLSLMWALTIMVIGLGLFQFFPKQLLSIFESVGNDVQTLYIGVIALSTISISFPFAAFGIILVGAFNAIGKGIYSLIVSATRQVIVILPAAFLLAKYVDSPARGASAIWWAYPIAEIVGLSLSVILIIAVFKKYIIPLSKTKNTDTVEELNS